MGDSWSAVSIREYSTDEGQVDYVPFKHQFRLCHSHLVFNDYFRNVSKVRILVLQIHAVHGAVFPRDLPISSSIRYDRDGRNPLIALDQ